MADWETTKINFLKLLLFFLLGFGFRSFSEVYSFSNTNLCARQSLDPANSVYLLMDGFAPGRAAMKRAYDLNLSSPELVKKVWAEYHKRAFYLSHKILNHLSNGQLPLLSDETVKSCHGNIRNCLILKNLVLENWNRVFETTPGKNVKCSWIKKAIPLNFAINFESRNPTRDDLEKLAMSYLDKNNYIDRCENILNLDLQNQPDLVLRLNFPPFKDSKEGFQFWNSFKIYLTYIWGLKINSGKFKFEDLSRSFAVEELMTLMADGCQSISKPECSSDFLNTSQFRDIIKKGKFDDNYLMANEILKAEITKAKNELNPDEKSSKQSFSAGNFDLRNQLLSTMKFRHQAQFQFYKSYKTLKTIFNQKKVNEIVNDLNTLEGIERSEAEQEKEVMCSELLKFSNKEVSGFAKEIIQARSVFAASENSELLNLWEKVIDLSLKLKPFCQDVENKLKLKMVSEDASTKIMRTKKWSKTVTQYLLPFDIQNDLTEKNQSRSHPYVKLAEEIICDNPIDCVRSSMESAVNLYQVMLYRNQALNKLPNELNAQGSLAGAVACQLYDPWAESQLRKKKLISDIISSVISGVTMLPIYLDLTFQQPQITSFKQLMDSGTIKFDPIFNENDIKKTLFIDLGPVARTNCYLSLSNSIDLNLHQYRYVFSGVTFQGCMKKAAGEMNSDLLSLTENKLNELSACGSCTLNFESVAMAAVESNYSVLRAGLRIFASLIYYLRESENPKTNPIEFQINSDYIVETFQKYNSIPDKCVYELINGSKCMEDLCVSKTVSELEKSTGLKVESASIWSSSLEKGVGGSDHPAKDVWVKIVGCQREERIPITCVTNRIPSFINISNHLKNLSCGRGQ
ncbi:MAG: hypothetical protein J0M15_09060 [Deltaproteobacteria bacterium]|nr:hypothetical protein [Deltaproteobacteria bacterium]